MLFFNKQYQAEKEIIDTLAKKIKESKDFFQRYEGNKEIFELDSGWIIFDAIKHQLDVESDGKTIISLDCEYDAFDELKVQRTKWFSNLLNYARKRQESESKKQKKETNKSAKMKKAKKTVLAKKAKTTNLVVLQDALDRIRAL